MKSRLISLLLLAASLLACKETPQQTIIPPVVEDPYLEVSPTDFNLDPDGGTIYASIASNRIATVSTQTSDNLKWCAAELLDTDNPQNLKITVAANLEPQQRTAILTVRADACDNATITITQDARIIIEDPVLTVSEVRFEAGADAQNFTATVTSNREVSVSSSHQWCTASLTDDLVDNLLIQVAANTIEEPRTASITLSADECDNITITVIQAAYERPKSSDCDLLSFRIPGTENGLPQTISFDLDSKNRTLNAIYLRWIDKQNPQMLAPTFTHNGSEVLVDGKPVISGQTALSFAEPFELVVVAENGDSKTYTVDLNCPQINTELPVLRLQPKSEINSKEVYVETTLTLYDPISNQGSWSPEDGKVDVRGRGNSTWGLPKKPYRIKFPSKFSPIGLNHAKAKSWVILAHDMDKSLIRNHIAFELSRVMFNAAENYHHPSAIMFTPCSKFVNVYMNSYYHGVYQMSDQMEQDEGRIAVEKLTDKDGSDPVKITGGHIIETDIHSAYPPERFNSSHRIQMNHTYPKDDEYDPAQYKYMENFVTQAETALYGSDFKDPDKGWRKYMDEKTLADFIIIKEFVGDMDGYTSTYFYKRRGVDKLFFGPIWDCDKGWNNDKRNTDRNPLGSLMIYAGFYMPPYINPDWFHRLWQDETFRQFVGKRWAAKRSELLATVFRVLDEQPKKMPKAINANFSVWQFYYQASNEANMPAATYELEIERMRTLTNQRAALLDNLFK